MSAPRTEAMARTGRGTQASTDVGRAQPVSWLQTMTDLADGQFWLTTVRGDGSPHVVPVFAVWVEPVLCLASNRHAAKARYLERDERCALATATDAMHLVVEGRATHVTEAEMLARVSAAYEQVYGWPTRVSEGRLDADYGAPTSGGPPYEVYAVRPDRGFAFPLDGESSTPTRWTFAAA